MNCDDYRALLTDHAHAEVGPAERRPLLRHLARCSACALEYCRLLADLDGIQASLEDPPAALGRKVRAAFERELRPRGIRRISSALRRPIPAYALAAALLLPIALWARHGGDRSGASNSGGRAAPTQHSPGLQHSPVNRGALARPGSGAEPHRDQDRYDAAGPSLAAYPIL
jgi:anti-sigma factor RsiW